VNRSDVTDAVAGLVHARAAEETMRIKIHGGTSREDAASLCLSCRHSRVTRGCSADEEFVVCEASPMRPTTITFRVTSCSHYTDQQYPTYYELIQQAWILQPGSRRRRPGFVPASDLRDVEIAQCMAALEKSED
jgi:hypothetical protein